MVIPHRGPIEKGNNLFGKLRKGGKKGLLSAFQKFMPPGPMVSHPITIPQSLLNQPDATDAGVSLFAGDDDIERASRSLKAISHPLRLKILCTLGEQEVSVQDIVDRVGTSQSNISQHLAILRDKGILMSRKDANRVYYRVSDGRTLLLIAMMREIFCHHA